MPDNTINEFRVEFTTFKDECHGEWVEFMHDSEAKMNQFHAENRARLQDIAQTSISNQAALAAIAATLSAQDVKLATLWGKGSLIEKLTDKLEVVSDQIKYSAGFIAAVMLIGSIIGWFLEHK